jgi:polysaccharide biosynthesis/export protein ExoF
VKRVPLFHKMIVTGMVLVLAGSTAAEEGASPRLGRGDQLRLKVFGQPDLSDVIEIGRNGEVTVPGVGSLSGVADLEGARERIGILLKEKLGIANTAFSLSVQSFRPVIVGGSVGRPGEVAYKAGMRVAHAIALAGGQGGRVSDDLSREITVNQERERYAVAQTKLARSIAKEARLQAELSDKALNGLPEAISDLIGPDRAKDLLENEKQLMAFRIQNRDLERRRAEASATINTEDIVAQEAITKSLSAQLELVRGDLARLEPLFAQRTITGARILELRRDYVQIEGQAGQSLASLAQAKTRQVVLAEERKAIDLQYRLGLFDELIAAQFEILEAEAGVETTGQSLEAAGADLSTLGRRSDPGDCKLTILRDGDAGQPDIIEADALTQLLPGDLLQVGRATRRCSALLNAQRVSE